MGRINIVKMAILPKAIYRFNVIPIKLPMTFFTELEITLKCIWNHKRPRTAKAILKKKNKAGGITLLGFRQYNKATVIKPAKQTYGSMEQNREPRNKPTHLWLINLQQRRQDYTVGKSLFSKWCWESWTTTCESARLEHTLFTIHKNKLKTT